MNKKYLLVPFECIGLQIFFALLSMVFYISVIPPMLFSFFSAWLFLWTLHSTFWQLGNKERKQIAIANRHLDDGVSIIRQKRYKGALIALPFFVINITILLLTYITNNDILVFVESFLHFSFSGFLPLVNDTLDNVYVSSRLLVCLAMYIPCVTAYISGSYNFSITEIVFPKILYKSKPGNKQD
ncbi:MAG: hypothetical protein IKV73_08150 [Clostridia bacterium]|nr:hypothetical protein [Clostridia bacterium]